MINVLCVRSFSASNMPQILAAGAVEALADLVPSPDPQVQMLASRAVSLFALNRALRF